MAAFSDLQVVQSDAFDGTKDWQHRTPESTKPVRISNMITIVSQ